MLRIQRFALRAGLRWLRLAPLAGLLVACGGLEDVSAPPSEPLPLLTGCPCPTPYDASRMDVLIGSTQYEAEETGLLRAVTGVPVPPTFASTLDACFAITGGSDEDGSHPVLYVAGCRGGTHYVCSFADSDSGGLANDKIGELVIASDMRLVLLESHLENNEIYAIDELGDRIVLLRDTNDDRVIDSVSTFVDHTLPASTDQLIPSPKGLSVLPGGVLLVTAMEEIADDMEVSVVTDADGDGAPESTLKTTYAAFAGAPPKILWPPAVGDDAYLVLAPPAASLEIWITDGAGGKISTDPGVARVALGTVPANASRATLVRTLPPALGQYITPFNVTADKKGPASLVLLPYPRATSAAPTNLRTDVASALVISGIRFDASVVVALHSNANPALHVILGRTVDSATSITAAVPVLGAQWTGPAYVDVTSATSPAEVFHVPLHVDLPP